MAITRPEAEKITLRPEIESYLKDSNIQGYNVSDFYSMDDESFDRAFSDEKAKSLRARARGIQETERKAYEDFGTESLKEIGITVAPSDMKRMISGSYNDEMLKSIVRKSARALNADEQVIFSRFNGLSQKYFAQDIHSKYAQLYAKKPEGNEPSSQPQASASLPPVIKQESVVGGMKIEQTITPLGEGFSVSEQSISQPTAQKVVTGPAPTIPGVPYKPRDPIAEIQKKVATGVALPKNGQPSTPTPTNSEAEKNGKKRSSSGRPKKVDDRDIEDFAAYIQTQREYLEQEVAAGRVSKDVLIVYNVNFPSGSERAEAVLISREIRKRKEFGVDVPVSDKEHPDEAVSPKNKAIDTINQFEQIFGIDERTREKFELLGDHIRRVGGQDAVDYFEDRLKVVRHEATTAMQNIEFNRILKFSKESKKFAEEEANWLIEKGIVDRDKMKEAMYVFLTRDAKRIGEYREKAKALQNGEEIARELDERIAYGPGRKVLSKVAEAFGLDVVGSPEELGEAVVKYLNQVKTAEEEVERKKQEAEKETKDKIEELKRLENDMQERKDAIGRREAKSEADKARKQVEIDEIVAKYAEKKKTYETELIDLKAKKEDAIRGLDSEYETKKSQMEEEKNKLREEIKRLEKVRDQKQKEEVTILSGYLSGTVTDQTYKGAELLTNYLKLQSEVETLRAQKSLAEERAKSETEKANTFEDAWESAEKGLDRIKEEMEKGSIREINVLGENAVIKNKFAQTVIDHELSDYPQVWEFLNRNLQGGIGVLSDAVDQMNVKLGGKWRHRKLKDKLEHLKDYVDYLSGGVGQETEVNQEEEVAEPVEQEHEYEEPTNPSYQPESNETSEGATEGLFDNESEESDKEVEKDESGGNKNG